MAKDKGKKKSEKPNKDEIVKVDEIKETAKRQISEEFEAGDEKVDKSQVISAKKVVYIEIDDEVTSVYDRIKSVRSKHIYIVAPKRAILFKVWLTLKFFTEKLKRREKLFI